MCSVAAVVSPSRHTGADSVRSVERRARRSAGAQVRGGGYAEVVGSSERYDSTTEAPNTRLHGYGLLNLSAGYAVARDWSLNARWNNVLDRDYELIQFFNTPRSNLFMWVVWQPR